MCVPGGAFPVCASWPFFYPKYMENGDLFGDVNLIAFFMVRCPNNPRYLILYHHKMRFLLCHTHFFAIDGWITMSKWMSRNSDGKNIWKNMFHMFHIPSDKRLHNYGKSPCFMGKSTINGQCSNSYVSLPEGTIGFKKKPSNSPCSHCENPGNHWCGHCVTCMSFSLQGKPWKYNMTKWRETWTGPGNKCWTIQSLDLCVHWLLETDWDLSLAYRYFWGCNWVLANKDINCQAFFTQSLIIRFNIVAIYIPETDNCILFAFLTGFIML